MSTTKISSVIDCYCLILCIIRSNKNHLFFRSNSVKEQQSSSFLRKSGVRRLQRTSSIKDLSTPHNGLFIGEVSPFIAKRWGSRESLDTYPTTQEQNIHHSYLNECSYSGVAPQTANSSDSSVSYGGGGSRAWSTHINMLRQDMRTARVAAEVAAEIAPSSGGSSAFYGE